MLTEMHEPADKWKKGTLPLLLIARMQRKIERESRTKKLLISCKRGDRHNILCASR